MNKLALILHGWPQAGVNNIFLERYLRESGYEIFIPNLFELDYNSSLKSEVILEEISSNIIVRLKKREPDVIVGISMGGLILPTIAKRFPQAKLVFIASASKFVPAIPLMKLILNLIRFRFLRIVIFVLLKFVPKSGLKIIYRMLNPFSGDKRLKEVYESDMRRNLAAINNYPYSKHMEIFYFITSVDNSSLLKQIYNKTLIFSSSNDKLMPFEEGKRLSILLSNSMFIVCRSMHFNVFRNRNIKDIEGFLRN